jgi:cellulose synthase/poly-beta-1,6-N-acetylglucosamine synthase-like glycosyltransferase
MSTVIVLAFCCATVPAVLWVWNMLIYREPHPGGCGESGHCVLPGSVSVLIPARNEERVLGATLASLLASRGVEIEVVVLDDGSTAQRRLFAGSLSRMRAYVCGPRPRYPAAGMGSSTPAMSWPWLPVPIHSVFSMQTCVSHPRLWPICRRFCSVPAPTW